MSLLALNGPTGTQTAVLNADIDMPLNTRWYADCVLDQPTGDPLKAGDRVELVTNVDSFSLTLVGAVAPDRNGPYLDATHVRVVGGAGGIGNLTTPQAYQQVIIRDILKDLMKDSGETLSSTIDPSFLTLSIDSWVTTEMPVANLLTALLDKFVPTFDWRFLPDGTLWMGVETWPDLDDNYVVNNIVQNPVDGSFDLGVETPYILPGMNIPGIGHIAQASHSILMGKTRTHALVTLNLNDRSIQASTAALVAASLPTIDYLGKYNATVISQNASGNVDVRPDDTRLPSSISNLQIRYGDPGVSAKVRPGALVQIAFDAGDPSKPFVELWMNSSVIELNISATTIKLNSDAATWAKIESAGVTLGTNPIVTPILTVGTVDSMGVPCTNSPSNTGTVKAG